MKEVNVLRKTVLLTAIFLFCMSVATSADEPNEITHWEFQTVDSDGDPNYSGPNEVSLVGIILNKPGDMVDPTPDYQGETAGNVGGQWQIFIQGMEGDHAGTAVWIGQNYSATTSPPGENYTNEEWISELQRLNAARFRPGDKVKVTGHYMGYKGKNNINEQHWVDPNYNFTIEVLEKNVGLAEPEVVTLDELVNESGDFNFQQNRESGCEFYQSQLVRINDVNFAASELDWGPDSGEEISFYIKDSNGLEFPVKLGLGSGIYQGSNNLEGQFDVIGIFDQEPPAPPYPPDGTSGYRIWVMDYDGNGEILGSTEHIRACKPADTNLDGTVDFGDFAKFAEDWLK